MDVSVIIPFRGGAGQALEHCIQALQAQEYEAGRVEVLLVDQDATDLSRELANRFPEVNFLRTVHPSIYAARNCGAKAATGTVLFFTEPGCVAQPDWITQHLRALATANVSVSVGRVGPMRSSWLLSMFLAYEDVRDRWNFRGAFWRQYFGRPSNLAIRRDRFEAYGPFEEVIRGGDSLLVQKIAREGSCDEITYCPEAVVKNLSLQGMPSCLRQRFYDSRIMSILNSSHAAPVSRRDRIRLFYETLNTHHYGPLRGVLLFFLLALGVLTWKAGRWSTLVYPMMKKMYPGERRGLTC